MIHQCQLTEKKHNCEHVLLTIVEDWKSRLKNDEYSSTIFIDLFNAFDSIPHALLIATLRACGVGNSSIEFFFISYLNDRSKD